MSTTQRKGPLAGIKVLEFAGLAPAPFCGMILSDFGAEVIRVDRFGTSGQDRLTRGKKSISIDLKKKAGIDLVLSLIEKVDVVLEPFRPGVVERLGFGPDVALKRNPKVIYARLTGWGQTGPLSNAVGHDINYIAISGALSRLGRHGERPLFPSNYLADFAGGGLLCAFGIVLALHERNKSGRGQVIDSAMVDGVAYLSAFLFSHYNQGLWKLERGVNALDSGAHFYEVYETKDNKYVAVGAIEPQFYAALLKGLGLDGDTTLPQQLDVSEWPAMKAKFAQIFSSKTRDQWVEIFKNTDACVSPVVDINEVMQEPHNASRNVYVQDSEKQWMPAAAPRLSRTPAEGVYKDGPLQGGQHSVVVLKEAGFSGGQIEEMLKNKIVYQADMKASL